jgi:hypothetical protein
MMWSGAGDADIANPRKKVVTQMATSLEEDLLNAMIITIAGMTQSYKWRKTAI